MNGELRRVLASLTGSPVLWDCPLREYTSFAIGGPAMALVTVEKLAELQRVLVFLEEQKIPWRMIGRGTNLLVNDRGFAGVILILGKGFGAIGEVGTRFDPEPPAPENVGTDSPPPVGGPVLRVGAGCSLARLVGWCTDRGLTGLEFAAGIPGTVGGAVIMNAGAWGREMAGVLVSVTVITAAAEIRTLPRAELDFGYRIWHDYAQGLPGLGESRQDGGARPVVVGVELQLTSGDQGQIRSLCQSYREKRRAKQPAGECSAGSFFKNPQGDAAGRLIEASGLKGVRVGGAMVSPVHANFLVNKGGASAEDVITLMKKVQAAVWKDTGILLEPEVHFL
jgi:UDP-N-acetylmuramate dehydrogenase